MNPSTALARVLVDALARQGVRHAVLCPGSRSAPLAYALREAERAGRLQLHVRVDERSAGFLALGLAKLTRVPAVVVTTSGTAVANLHPAVLEAHHGVVPLIVVSADRPIELRGTGANQTTTQPGIFADATRWAVDLEAPVREFGQVARWRDVAARAVGHATGRLGDEGRREPGPVHLNVQLHEPLVPTDDDPWPEPLTVAPTEALTEPPTEALTAAATETPKAPTATLTEPSTEPSTEPLNAPTTDRAGSDSAARGDAGGGVSRDVARTLVLVGDLPEPDQFERAVAWAGARGWPVIAEPFGTHPRPAVSPHGPLALSDPDWVDAHAPERVVTVGRLTLSRPVAALLRRPRVRVEAVGAHAWIVSRPDVMAVHPTSVLDEATGETDPAGDADWAGAWRAAGTRVADAVSAERSPWPSGAGVADAVLSALPAGSTLFLGSSNAARDVDLAAPRSKPLHVLASRGLAGIDGCISTASGIALAGDAPTYALMGDLTFLHDTNGLLVGPLERRPDLTVVVTNDDGGGIFTLLEPGEPERATEFERLFGTPTGTDLAALCAAHHATYQRIETRDELTGALATAPSGLTVLEVPVDRDSHRELHARLRARAATALSDPDSM